MSKADYRTECEEQNLAGFYESLGDECGDECPRCKGGDYEDEDCCEDCQAELSEWAQEFAYEDRMTRRAESGWG